MIQYTSGSTNEPKGVMLSHSNLVNNLNLIHYGFQLEENVVEVSWLPHFHDMGLIGGILGPIFCGGTAILISPTTFLLKPNFWLSTITKYEATVSGAPNFAYDYCVEKVSLLEAKSLNLESWRIAFCGAEPIRYDSLERFAKKFEISGFNKESFYPCYGLAESTLLVSGNLGPIAPVSIAVDTNLLLENRVVLTVDEKNNKITKLVSSGKQLLNQKIIIVDTRTLQQRPDLEIGEIWVSSPSVGRGYWNRPEESQQIFEATLNNENDKSQYLRTGDLGFKLDGELFVAGRLKDLIIIRGKNYFPNDIESIAGISHKALRKGHCVAFSMEVGEKNEEKLFIAQELERRYHKLTNYHDIFLEIRKKIALNFDIQPYRILLLKPFSIPLTSSGKVRRKKTKQEFVDNKLQIVSFWTAE
jgi:acyl-CoA synthetase (AMP-forming)/AMP-acid ligase II